MLGDVEDDCELPMDAETLRDVVAERDEADCVDVDVAVEVMLIVRDAESDGDDDDDRDVEHDLLTDTD